MRKKLKKALVELVDNGQQLESERICEIYLLSAEARGVRRVSDMVFSLNIGSLPAVYAVSCENGILILAGYGEYGLGPSIALQHAVVRLVDAAKERAPEVFGTSEGTEENQEGETTTADGEAASDSGSATEEPSPSASTSAADESDVDTDAESGA
jgi:hypothetical protein